MVEIRFTLNERVISGIILAKFEYSHQIRKKIIKNLLWHSITKYKRIKTISPFYLVFIPWKHKEKEIILVKESDAINYDNIISYNDMIKVDEFTSTYCDNYFETIYKGVFFLFYNHL